MVGTRAKNIHFWAFKDVFAYHILAGLLSVERPTDLLENLQYLGEESETDLH